VISFTLPIGFSTQGRAGAPAVSPLLVFEARSQGDHLSKEPPQRVVSIYNSLNFCPNNGEYLIHHLNLQPQKC